MKLILQLVVISSIFTLIGVLIPIGFTSNIDNAFVYFLSSIWALNFILPAQTLLNAMAILAYFEAGVGVFWIFHFIIMRISD